LDLSPPGFENQPSKLILDGKIEQIDKPSA
jgi:hypothetical protein